MDSWVWAIVILVAGLGLAMLEVFVPSGGILGFLSVAAVIASVVLAFYESPAIGFTMLGVAVVGLPSAFSVALHFFPRTSMGRRVILGPPTDEEVSPDDDVRRHLKSLVGKYGVTTSVMLPSGRVRIEDRLYDATSEGLAIEANQSVVVVEVRSGGLVVRAAKAPQSAPKSDGTLLDRPFESWGIDPFKDGDSLG
jgi:membrane-bound ClpP family serine protease